MDTVLVTGGAGFVGSHTVIELIKANYDVVILDNFVNAKAECLRRVEKLVGRSIPFYEVDLLNSNAVREVFKKHKFTHVIHFASLKAVGESIAQPIRYYQNNLIGALNLLEAMVEFGVRNFIFSSSATVYGDPKYLPIDEVHPVGSCTNPYGKSKYFIEEMARDVQHAHPEMNVVLLRYFNPVGAHESGEIGEDPQGVPNNLMPYVAQVAVGRRPFLTVFGNDYATPDGTGVRDYIHVVDLAVGHVAALQYLRQRETGAEANSDSQSKATGETSVINLGTGRGYSVLEMVAGMERASGRPVVYQIAARRPGDCASVYGDVKLAESKLGWKATRDINDMCADLWRFVSKNPQGLVAPEDAGGAQPDAAASK